MYKLSENPILAIVVVIIVVLIVIWLFRALAEGERGRRGGSRREEWGLSLEDSRESRDGSRESRESRDGSRVGCDGSGPKPRPPTNVECRSKKSFELEITWTAPRCDVESYLVYIKHTDEEDSDSSSSSSDSSSSQSRVFTQAGRRKRKCKCLEKYEESSRSSSGSSSSGSSSSSSSSNSSNSSSSGSSSSSSKSPSSSSSSSYLAGSSSSSSTPSSSSSTKSSDSSRRNYHRRHHHGSDSHHHSGDEHRHHWHHRSAHQGHEVGCGCDKSSSSSSSSTCSPSSSSSSSSDSPSSSSSSSSSDSSCSACSPDCGCGPDNFSEVIEVRGDQHYLKIVDLHVRSVCVAITAISKCGRESRQSECCSSEILCECEIFPCFTANDCKEVSIRWGRVRCAKHINVLLNGHVLYRVPGDAEGIKGLPPLKPTDHLTVTVESECGTSAQIPISDACFCDGDECGKVHFRSRDSPSSSSSSSSSSSDRSSSSKSSSSGSSSSTRRSRRSR